MADLSTAASRPDWQSISDIDIPVSQRHLSAAIDEALQHQLTASAPSIRARALAMSTALPHAGDWLNGVPSAALGQGVPCLSKVLAGSPSTQFSLPLPGMSRNSRQIWGSSSGNADRIYRHNAVRDVLYIAAQSAALVPTREAAGLVADSLSRPADILIPTWLHGISAACDVHVDLLTTAELGECQGG